MAFPARSPRKPAVARSLDVDLRGRRKTVECDGGWKEGELAILASPPPFPFTPARPVSCSLIAFEIQVMQASLVAPCGEDILLVFGKL